MALETNLNATPYWDDFNQNKDFYRILFKPGVSVQTRELNQIQSIIQNQIERFGDHLFKSGTIVSGVNFIYNPLYPYVKINDLSEDGQPVNVSSYLGLYLKNSANLQAVVVNYQSGFESKNPDLNTLYINYINSGNNFSLTEFANGELLDVFNRNDQLYGVNVVNGGTGFANSDTLFIVPAIDVKVSSGTFTNGEIVTQATTGAKVQIVGISTGIDSNNKIISVKPLLNDQLSNTSANSTTWTIVPGYNITGNTSGAVANVSFLVGGGASGVITTDSLGIISSISLSSGGTGFTTLPVAVVKPSSASASVSTLDLLPRKYYTQLRIANSSYTTPVGFGYAFSVTEGIIYQKGTFSRVLPQTVVVSKYSSAPSNVSVGFTSNESIVKYTTDSTLYDNAANTYNEGAPGADRLKIRPTLYVVETDVGASNSEFLPLVQFVEGLPAKENRETVYNEISKEYERRTYETSGDFVINSFNASTKEIASNTTHFNVVIDPGTAYIRGKRVSTKANVIKSVTKANTFFSRSNQTITANYGNYVKVKNLAGFFNFKSGTTVSLYDTAKNYLSGVTVGSSATITPAGSSIGSARMRSLVYESGIIGTPDAVYRMYLFDITMDAGKSFSNVKAFYYDGSYDGICDAITEISGTTNSAITYLYDTENPDIIFKTGLKAVKSISDISYTYRTTTEDLTLNSNGTIQITAPVSYTFPYSGGITISSSQERDFIVAPVSNVVAANASGSVAGNTTLDYIVGTSTSFNTEFSVGDYVKVMETGGGSVVDIRRVTNIVNSTYMVLNANLSFTDSNANVALFFPAYYPIDFNRTGRSITTSANSSVVTLDIGNSSLTSTANVVATYNIKIPNATQINKDLNRDLYVKIYTGNNTTVSAGGNNTSGPWSLGIPDVFRLKNVYLGNTATDTDITKYFYIDSQSDGDKVKIAQLRLVKGANLAISNTQWLLAKFDAYDINSSEGFITINSYNDIINDASGFSNGTYINTLEVPEILTTEGRYYDARDVFDFRPYSVNTATYATSVGSASVNPSSTDSLNTDEKYFPVPDSEITFDIDYYIPRIDRVVLHGSYRLEKENRDRFNELIVLTGTPNDVNLKSPEKPSNSLSISRIFVPPYPSIPYSISNTTFQILDRRIGNDTTIVGIREKEFKVKSLNSTQDNRSAAKPYTMESIGKLERRINAIEKEILLSKLEKSIVDKTIPSSNNPSKERFKNGFVVDGFDDVNVVDLNNVENSCFIDVDKSELQPLKFTYNLESIFDRSDNTTLSCITGGSQLMLKYVEVPLIQQLNASKPRNAVDPVVNNSTGTSVSDTNTTVVVQSVSDTKPVTISDPTYNEVIIGPSEILVGDFIEIKCYGGVPDSTFSWTGPTSGSNRLSSGGTIFAYFPFIGEPGTYTWVLTFNGSGNVRSYTVTVKSKFQKKADSGSSLVTSLNNNLYIDSTLNQSTGSSETLVFDTLVGGGGNDVIYSGSGGGSLVTHIVAAGAVGVIVAGTLSDSSLSSYTVDMFKGTSEKDIQDSTDDLDAYLGNVMTGQLNDPFNDPVESDNQTDTYDYSQIDDTAWSDGDFTSYGEIAGNGGGGEGTPEGGGGKDPFDESEVNHV